MMDQPIDFERSILSWVTRDGSHGHWRVVACATNLATSEVFALTPMVMAGHVYGPKLLPMNPPYSYQMVASRGRHVIFRDFPGGAPSPDIVADHGVTFSKFDISLCRQERRPVAVDALCTGGPWPLIAQLRAVGRDGVSWVLDFPVNHLNHRVSSDGRAEFQVETGPLLVPAGLVSREGVGEAGGFTLAYVFFNRLDRADVALWTPVPFGGRAFGKTERLDRVSIEVCLDGSGSDGGA